ncbi:MAG: hypothetical protein LUQ02_04740, partial [Methanothrix sp.]|nr:hypothetical protein [Methanothrix sp.]
AGAAAAKILRPVFWLIHCRQVPYRADPAETLAGYENKNADPGHEERNAGRKRSAPTRPLWAEGRSKSFILSIFT